MVFRNKLTSTREGMAMRERSLESVDVFPYRAQMSAQIVPSAFVQSCDKGA
jgi:hypothetical protein